MKIIITGVPGTGKTSVARELKKKLNLKLIEIAKLVKEKSLTSGYDKKMKCKVVDLKKLKNEIRKKVKGLKNFIIEGHLACEIGISADYVFVLRCFKDELKRRLKKRGYSKDKINENILSELLDYCYIKVKENYKNSKICEIETGKKSKEEVVKKIIRVIKNNEKCDKVNYEKDLKEFLGLW